MKQIKVSEATNIQLDWLVARCEGLSLPPFPGRGGTKECWINVSPAGHDVFAPTTSWSQMGPIIDREKISIRHWDNTPVIHAYLPTPGSDWSEGQTSLIAAARCYVTSKLGDTADIPDEL